MFLELRQPIKPIAGVPTSLLFVAKAVMIGINLAMLGFTVWKWGVFASFQQLTNIVLLIETVHLIASLKCSTDPQIKQKLNWLVLHHVTFELICAINFIVVTVYWTVLREGVLRDYCDTPAIYFHTTIVHLLPFLHLRPMVLPFRCSRWSALQSLSAHFPVFIQLRQSVLSKRFLRALSFSLRAPSTAQGASLQVLPEGPPATLRHRREGHVNAEMSRKTVTQQTN